MIIRDAQASDFKRIMEIWNPIIRSDSTTFTSLEHTEHSLAGILDDKRKNEFTFLVLEEDRIVQGFAYYGQFRSGVGYQHSFENTIYIASEQTGKGLGRTLMEKVEEHARCRGGHSMIAGISAENTAACSFHARLGYAEVARIPEAGYKFGRWHDLVLMQKFL